MKTIKKYWAVIVGAILALLAVFITADDKITKRKIKKTDKQIDDNNHNIDVIQGKTEIIDDQRANVKQDIKDTKTDIQTLQNLKQDVHITELPVDQAKQNILNKTRRGRKPKK
jgi:uncharacterized protein YoxC